MSEEVMAYLAGIFDGDGSFSLIKKTGTRSPFYFPMIQIASRSSELIEFLHDLFPGFLHIRKEHHAKDGGWRSTSYQWKLEKQNKCRPFLEAILPYLVIKKERAELVLNFIKKNPFVRGSRPLSDSVLFDREKDYIRMRNFNAERLIHKNLHRQTGVNTECPKFWSYLAGLIDTDGSLSIKREVRSIGIRYSPVILLTMSDVKGINFIRDHFTYGKTCIVKATSCQAKISYRWGVYAKEHVISMLKSCLSFLKVKQKSAEILLEFCEKFTKTKYCRMGVSKENMEMRENSYNSLIKANKYGVSKPMMIDLEA